MFVTATSVAALASVECTGVPSLLLKSYSHVDVCLARPQTGLACLPGYRSAYCFSHLCTALVARRNT